MSKKDIVEESLFDTVINVLMEDKKESKILEFKNTDYMISMFKDVVKNDTVSEVIDGIEKINDEICRLQEISDKKLIEERESILSFLKWFESKYKNSTDIISTIEEIKSKETLPIFDVKSLFDKIDYIFDGYEIYKKLSIKDKYNIDRVIEYILGIDNQVNISISFINGNPSFREYVIDNDTLLLDYGTLMSDIIFLLCNDGGMVIRIIADKCYNIITGLTFINGIIITIDEATLQDAMKYAMDEIGEYDDTFDVYTEAPLKFM